MKGLRISVNRQFYDFQYNISQLTDPISIGRHARNRGIGRISLIESFIVNRRIYNIYSWVDGPTINQFDLNSKIAFGDIIIVALKNTTLGEMALNVDITEFMKGFESIDIEMSEGEEEDYMEDEYNFDDGFLVLDSDYDDKDEDFFP